MLRLLAAFEGVVFFRHGAGAIPASMPLFVLVLGIDFVITLLGALSVSYGVVEAMLSFMIGITMTYSLAFLILQTVGQTPRFLPVITALTGADALIGLGVIATGFLGADFSDLEQVDRVGAALVALFVLHVWSLAVFGFVIKRAANLSILPAAASVAALYVLSGGAASLLLGR